MAYVENLQRIATDPVLIPGTPIENFFNTERLSVLHHSNTPPGERLLLYLSATITTTVTFTIITLNRLRSTMTNKAPQPWVASQQLMQLSK